MLRFASLLVIAACSEAHRPDWPAPDSTAASTCAYETTAFPDPYEATSRVYYDANNRVYRVDGFRFGDDTERFVRAPSYFDYDDQGRLER